MDIEIDQRGNSSTNNKEFNSQSIDTVYIAAGQSTRKPKNEWIGSVELVNFNI